MLNAITIAIYDLHLEYVVYLVKYSEIYVYTKTNKYKKKINNKKLYILIHKLIGETFDAFLQFILLLQHFRAINNDICIYFAVLNDCHFPLTKFNWAKYPCHAGENQSEICSLHALADSHNFI